VIDAFAIPKHADSNTVPGKIEHAETQEGVGQYPKGDDKPDGKQKALRVEEGETNINDLDKAIEEAQDTDKQAVDDKGECDNPGEKKRSKGKGRGLARGQGQGPIGIPAEDHTLDR